VPLPVVAAVASEPFQLVHFIVLAATAVLQCIAVVPGLGHEEEDDARPDKRADLRGEF